MSCLLLALAGCNKRALSVTVVEPDHPANLVMSDNPDDAYVASQLTDRLAWPSVENGYRFDTVTYYSRTSYDYQRYYNKFGGSYHSGESVEAMMFVGV